MSISFIGSPVSILSKNGLVIVSKISLNGLSSSSISTSVVKFCKGNRGTSGTNAGVVPILGVGISGIKVGIGEGCNSSGGTAITELEKRKIAQIKLKKKAKCYYSFFHFW